MEIDEQIKEVYRRIAIGDPVPHGSFVTAFAEAVWKADRENFYILKPVAIQIMRKYDLDLQVLNQLLE